MLDEAIVRFQASYTTVFSKRLWQRYEQDTAEDRHRHLEFTMAFGGIAFVLTALTDFAFLPDIGFDGIWLRCAALPVCIVAAIAARRATADRREQLVVASGTFMVIVLTCVPLLSTASSAPAAFMSPIFGLAFGNTTVVPRFRLACISTAICCLAMAAAALWQSPLGWAVCIEIMLVGSFSLLANYRIQRHELFEYLLSSREAQRTAALNADREKLKALSDTDGLTGLANRGACDRHCEEVFNDPKNIGTPIAVLLADVDHFKAYNDYYGHLAGDECLRIVSGAIAAAIRGKSDLVARFGGEEFIACILGIDADKARLLGERLCAAVRDLDIQHFGRSDALQHVTISVGVATATISPSLTVEAMIDAADRALYQAKNGGRNRLEATYLDAA
ncbi:GGDEF domain-containing protein [Hyphomicrobium sp. 1Nfss2.1]|uniref:GGDEF domain-containing protein n=1 Tax=Hyphomicrobium sp. 1Nfss2.1 TaxID=3413936 RepID=UPI003C7C303F